MTAETPKQTPLVDLLRGVPSDGRAIYEHSTTHSQSIPYGRLCHDAANDLTAAREQIAALTADRDSWAEQDSQHVGELVEARMLVTLCYWPRIRAALLAGEEMARLSKHEDRRVMQQARDRFRAATEGENAAATGRAS